MADPVQEEIKKRRVLDLLDQGYGIGQDVDFADNRLVQLFRASIIGDVVRQLQGGPVSGWQQVFTAPDVGPLGKAAYTAGRIGADLTFDGSRVPYWLLNHPLAQVSVASEMGSTLAGLSPDYHRLVAEMQKPGAPPITRHQADEEFARRMGFRYSESKDDKVATRGLPLRLAEGVLPLLASTTMVATSGNHDLMNLAQGGRTPGYAAVLPKDGSLKETSNAPAELALRYIVGRTGRLLPWEQFTAERPEISPEDYAAAKRHQFDKGVGNIGLFKATGRNLEGEPEFTMMGFRVPLSASASAGGALVGGIGGAQLADHLIGQALQKRQSEPLEKTQLDSHDLSLQRKGNRRLVGAILGALAGQAIGRGTADVVNERIIQPRFYPERVAAEHQWLAGAAQRELDARRAQELTRLQPRSVPQQNFEEAP